MTRGLSSDQLAAAIAPHRQVVPLLEMYFDSGTLRLALGPWDVTSLQGTYTHTGPLVSVDAAKESSASQQGLQFTMSGLDPAVVEIAVNEPYRGRIAKLLKAFISRDTNALIGQPTTEFVGRMQSMTISEDSTQASVTLVVEHYETELTRPMPLRYSDADQQRLFPGDLGCQYAARTSDQTVIFPSKQAQGG